MVPVLRTVVLTRPAGENEQLAEMLAERDYQSVVRPLLKLSEVVTSQAMKNIAMNLERFDKVIFVSKSSVRFGMPLLESYWPAWPARLQWLTVGSGTAEVLRSYGVAAQFPETPGSEGLLALPALAGDIEACNILIVRGAGGRELLADTLRQRHASVTYLEAYVREAVSYPDLAELPPDSVVVLTSAEILENFIRQITPEVRQFRAVVPSSRIEQLAANAGFTRVTNAGGASDQALYDAIVSGK